MCCRAPQNAGLRKVEVRVVEKGDGLDLVLDVQEKWTLLPIPFVAVYQKKLTLGAGVLESNFLGTLNSLGGFFFLQDGTPGFFGFSQWALNSSRSWILSFSPQWMGRDVEVWDGERKSGEYKERIGAFSMGLVHRFEGGWEFGGRVDAQWFQLGDGPYEGRYDGAPFGMTIGWNGQRVVEDRMQGFEWKVGALWDSGLFGSALRRRAGTVQWVWLFRPGSGFIMLEQSGAVSDGLVPGWPTVLAGKGSSCSAGARYHEDQFRTTAWMVTSVEWRLQVWTTSSLRLGLSVCDHGLFRDDGRAGDFVSRTRVPGLFAQGALPGLLDLSWAAENRELSGGVTAGIM